MPVVDEQHVVEQLAACTADERRSFHSGKAVAVSFQPRAPRDWRSAPCAGLRESAGSGRPRRRRGRAMASPRPSSQQSSIEVHDILAAPPSWASIAGIPPPASTTPRRGVATSPPSALGALDGDLASTLDAPSDVVAPFEVDAAGVGGGETAGASPRHARSNAKAASATIRDRSRRRALASSRLTRTD